MRVGIENLSWQVGGRPILDRVAMDAEPGETIGLIGPNGSGKSSLLRCLGGLRTPHAGIVRYDGQDIGGWTPRRIAADVAFVEQTSGSDSDLRVSDVVALGRTSFRDR